MRVAEKTTDSPTSISGTSSLESERWREDLRLREIELNQKHRQIEQDHALRREELQLKQDENKRARWNNPLTIAIVAAALAGFSNAAVTFVNGVQQNNLQNDKQKDDFQLERSKAETARILEMIKTGNRDTAASNLDFLLQTGLIQDEKVVEKLAAYLKNLPPGGGTVLPAPISGTSFDFVASSALTDMQKELSAELEKFIQHLRQLQYEVLKGRAKIKVELMKGPNAYYSPATEEIIVDIRALGEPDSVFYAYMNAMLLQSKKEDVDMCGHCHPLIFSISDYHMASYLNDPETATMLAVALKSGKNFIRDLRVDFDWKVVPTSSEDTFEDSEDARNAWNSLFWDMRDSLGADLSDMIIARAWGAFQWPEDKRATPLVFVKSLLRATQDLASASQLSHVESLLRERKFPVDG